MVGRFLFDEHTIVVEVVFLQTFKPPQPTKDRENWAFERDKIQEQA